MMCVSKAFIFGIYFSVFYVESASLRELVQYEPRIVGGTDAEAGEYPFFVQWSGCGASLIWEDILLSAGHCNVLSSNNVLVGAFQKGLEEGEPVNSVRRTITERRLHPGYVRSTFSNDFLVLKLDRPVDQPQIPWNKDENYPNDYDPVTVIGFGGTEPRSDLDSSNETAISIENSQNGATKANLRTRSGDGSILKLQEVTVEVIPNEVCNSNSMYRGHVDGNVMVCAGFEDGGQDACYGDSGGPLFTRVGGNFIQVGIVSFGVGCARPNRPGVYSRVSSASEWIQEQICDLSENPPTACPGVFDTPSNAPSVVTSNMPSMEPSSGPSIVPTAIPSNLPSFQPSKVPSKSPTTRPSTDPSSIPSFEPTVMPSNLPSFRPSKFPSKSPTNMPSTYPSSVPSFKPTAIPSQSPSSDPSEIPSAQPSSSPAVYVESNKSLILPTGSPNLRPSGIPSDAPSIVPSSEPFLPTNPSLLPSTIPSSIPSSEEISDTPSISPTPRPTDRFWFPDTWLGDLGDYDLFGFGG